MITTFSVLSADDCSLAHFLFYVERGNPNINSMTHQTYAQKDAFNQSLPTRQIAHIGCKHDDYQLSLVI